MSRKKQVSKNQIDVVSLSKYTTPVIQEQSNREWVEYGADNNYFQFLIDRYTKSTTNGAIINGMVKTIYGKGLDATNSSKRVDQFIEMKSIFSKNAFAV